MDINQTNLPNKKNSLADFLSILPLLIIIYYTLDLFYSFFDNGLIDSNYSKIFKKSKYVFGLLYVTSSIQLFKYIIPYPKKWHKITMRPEGACDCDYLSSKGIIKNRCGMPSGHMGTTTFFAISNVLYIIKKNNSNLFVRNIMVISNILFVIMMGWARMIKHCHNLPQVSLGTLYGGVVSYLFFK